VPDVKEELAGWIDTDVIGELILDGLKEEGAEPTLEYAKRVWLDVLECELNDAIENAITAVSSL
jgi:hypothetical protein